jgi:hypothetical protein
MKNNILFGRMIETRKLLGTDLVFEAGEQVDLYPATNQPLRNMFYACKRGGQDGILLESGVEVEVLNA